MKKFLIIAGIIVVVVGIWAVGQYNSLISAGAQVDKAWSDVLTQYQRRNDLVPQLVATVQGAANFEKSTLSAVVNARAKATQTNVDLTNPASLSAFSASQSELSGALSRLLVSVEAYPDIKTSANFRDLQSQLEGTENRIAVYRSDYNGVAANWNARIKRIPTVIIARLGGFNERALFSADEGAEKAPNVGFTVQE